MNRMSGIAAALLASVAFTNLTGCDADKPAAVKERAETPAVVVESEAAESTDPDPTESTEPEPEETTAPSMPTLGDLVTIADWDVKVTKVVLDAGAQMKAANMFNDKPKGQYVLVTYEATYTGAERTADASDLDWTFTTSDNRVNDQSYSVTPADDEEWATSARTGGTVDGQVCFDLPKNLIEGGILTAEGYDENFDMSYADFAL